MLILQEYIRKIIIRGFLPESNSVKPDIIFHSELKYPGDLYWTVTISWNGVKYEYEILEHLLQRKESGGLNIPQYFIFDKLKDKFYMNLSRPSSESVLYEEILKIVKME